MFSSITIVVTYVVLGLPGGCHRHSLGLVDREHRPALSLEHVDYAGRPEVRRAFASRCEAASIFPTRPCIFMANHVSNLDPPILFPELPFRTSFF